MGKARHVPYVATAWERGLSQTQGGKEETGKVQARHDHRRGEGPWEDVTRRAVLEKKGRNVLITLEDLKMTRSRLIGQIASPISVEMIERRS